LPAPSSSKEEARSDDEIYAALLPKAQPDKERDELKELGKIEKQLAVLVNGTEGTETTPPKQPFPSEEAIAALAQVRERIAALTITQDERKAA
jgi:hypothetical protein